MPAPTDKFKETANGGIPAVATVQTPRASGITSLVVDTQQYWPTASGVSFSTYKLDANGKKIDGSQIDWSGVSNGTDTISSLTRVGGAVDTGNAVNDKVRMGPTAQWADDLIRGLSAQHNYADGTHKSVTTDTLAVSGAASVAGNLAVTGGITAGGQDITQLTAPGTVNMFAGATAPTGWLLCDGAAVSRTTYATLFTALGTAYGSGDGSTTFNLPNFKGRAPFGKDSAQTEFASLGQTGGQKTLQAHSHGVNDPGHNHGIYGRIEVVSGGPGRSNPDPNNANNNTTTMYAATGISIQSAGSGANNLNPYLSVNFIIKV